MSAAIEPTESSPLIQTTEPAPEDHEQEQTEALGWSRDAVRTPSLAAVFLILFALADILKYISTVRLVEQGICREHYLEVDPGVIDDVGNISEDLCKSPAIQKRLAHLRGYLGALEAIVGLVFTLPYGLLVDRLGERLVVAVNVLGYLLSCAWVVIVCYYWSAFSISTAVLAPLFRIIGGGSPVLASVVYSIAAKHIPDANRSICFFFFMAAQLLTEIISINAAALFLDHGYLYTPMLLNFPLGALCIATIFMIGPDKTPGTLPDDEDEPSSEGESVFHSVRRSIRILSQLLRERNVIVLLATVPVAKLVNPITELMLQYIPKKFDLSLATASRALSIQAVESLVLLVLLLPVIKNVAQIKFHITSKKVDLYIVQYGFLVMSLGCLIMAFSQALIPFILGLLVFTFGCSTRPALQSILTDQVTREHIAVLYTAIAIGDGVGSAAGALVLNRTFAIAIGWDQKPYLGLPFVIGAACYILGFMGTLFVAHRVLSPKRNV